MFKSTILVIVATLSLVASIARGQSTAAVVDQTVPYVDPIIVGEITYRTGDELKQIVSFNGAFRVTNVTVRYSSTVPVNYVIRFFGGQTQLQRTVVLRDLPAGTASKTINLSPEEQFDWIPIVSTNILGVTSSTASYSVQLTLPDGSDSGQAAGPTLATAPFLAGTWINVTENVIESASAVGLVTFDFNSDQEQPVGFNIRIGGNPVAPPVPVTVSAVSSNFAAVRGGTPVNVTITLSAPAPAGGTVVTLSSSSSALRVPTSITVPAGARSVTFVATTSVVRRNTSVVLTARTGTTSRTLGLQILR